MSANWKQIFDANPTTTFNANDVFYLARSPYGPTDNFGFTYSSLALQFSSSNLTNTHIFVGNASNVATDVALSGDATLSNTGVLTVTKAALTAASDTNVTLTLGGSPATALVRAASITAGWSGQLSLTRGGTNASLTANDGGVVYSTASALSILAPPVSPSNNPLLSSLGGGAPHWSSISFPDTIAQNSILYSPLGSPNVLTQSQAGANQTLVSAGTGAISWSSTLPSAVQTNITSLGTVTVGTWNATTIGVGFGGTGTPTAFTTGSVVFAGASGVYTQDNSNFFWDNTNKILGLGTTTLATSTKININGVASFMDGGSRTFNAGVTTEVNASLIELGINDSSSNRFGGSYTSANQGGFLRFDARNGEHLFQVYSRVAGSTGATNPVFRLTSDGDTLFGPGSLATNSSLGFPSMPSTAGVPTGTPTNYSGGFIPFSYDTTNNRLRVYNSGWKFADANTLETYTPTIGDGTNNFTTSTASGQFSRSGNIVSFWLRIMWTSKGSASGNIRVSLPLTINASISRAAFTLGFGNGLSTTGFITLAANGNNAYTEIFSLVAGVETQITDASFSASGEIQISGTYFI